VVKLLSPSFYAMGNSRIPVIASAASVGVNIALSLVLVRSLGHRGLALSTAVAALLNAGLLLALLRARLDGLEGRRLLVAAGKIGVAATAMAIAAYYAERALHVPFRGDTVVLQSARVFGAIGVGIGVLAISALILRIEEFTQIRRRMLPFRTW
jgi:putative peptidoglycan lipid II flippase